MAGLSARIERLEKLAEAQRPDDQDRYRDLTDQQSRAIVVLWRDGWWPTWRDDWRGAHDPQGFESAIAAALEEAETLTYENTPWDPVAMEENHRRSQRWHAIFRPFMAWLQEQREYYEQTAATQGPSRR